MKPLIPLTKQLDFMMNELQGPERRAGAAFTKPFGTAADAATAWDKLYERSGGAGDARARAYATDVFNAFRDDPTGGQNLPPNARFAMGYLTQKGMPLQNAAGIVGRLMTESYASMDPAARTTLGGGHGTYGVAQWRGPRLEALANFAGVPIEDIRNAPVSNGEGQYYPVKSEAPMAGLLGGPAPQQMPQQAESPWKTGQAWNTIALALNSLRNNPDQGLAQALQGRLQQGQDRAQSSKTAAWLRAQGREDLASAIESGSLGGKDAMSLFYTPAKDTRTSQIQNYEYWLNQGKTPDEAAAMVKAGTTISLPGDEKAWSKGMGEIATKHFEDISSSAMSAMDTLGTLTQIEALMADPAFSSGTGTEAVTSMKKIVAALGGDPADVGSIEAFRAAVSGLTLDMMGGSLGAGFSEGDRKFVTSIAPNLDNTVQGNKAIVDIQRAIAERKIQIADLADQYIAENEMLDAKWPGYLREWARKNPLFPTLPGGVSTTGLSPAAQKYLGVAP